MKKIVKGVLVVSGIVALGSLGACHSVSSHPETERKFQGKWRTEYYLGNKDMRMLVHETATFDTLTHRYKIHQVQEIIYPVNILYANVDYEGSWKAGEKYFIGKIDQKTVRNELNPQFDEIEEYRQYRDVVRGEAEADLRNDEFLIREIEDGRIHLFDDDRDVAHDLIKVVPPSENPEKEITL
ncbi:MAG: hypothetical protein K2N05_06220 [Muribaculaceae bacterium]|nr:hypothetical protein [Muribaculaceae bacterium]